MNEHGELATVNVHLVDEHNQLRSEAEILAAVRDNLAAHIGMVEARIAVLEEHEENDPRPAADGEAGANRGPRRMAAISSWATTSPARFRTETRTNTSQEECWNATCTRGLPCTARTCSETESTWSSTTSLTARRPYKIPSMESPGR